MNKTPKKVGVIIVDDEIDGRNRIRDLLKLKEQIEVLDICEDGYTAIEAINQHQPDLLFLDIQIPGYSGLEMLTHIKGPLPFVIFITAFPQYALQAFEAKAIDYLLKPFSNERFYQSLSHALEMIQMKNVHEIKEELLELLRKQRVSDDNRTIQKLSIRKEGTTYFIDLKHIVYIEAKGDYANVYTKDGKLHNMRTTMNQLEKELYPASFFRVHRSAIVNASHIVELRHWTRGDYLIVTSIGKHLISSPKYKENIQTILSGRF